MASQNPVQIWFQSIDVDRSGHLDATEIQRALQMGGLHFDLTDIDAMLKAFDTEGNRVLDLNEFTRLHEFLTTVSQSFQQHDQSRSGALAVGSVQAALRQAGFNLDDTVVHVRGSMGLLMGHTGRMSGKGVHEANYACAGSAKHTTAIIKKHDPDQSGSLSMPEFIKMSLFLQSCVRVFTAFDPRKTGRAELTFLQFVYAASHVA